MLSHRFQNGPQFKRWLVGNLLQSVEVGFDGCFGGHGDYLASTCLAVITVHQLPTHLNRLGMLFLRRVNVE